MNSLGQRKIEQAEPGMWLTPDMVNSGKNRLVLDFTQSLKWMKAGSRGVSGSVQGQTVSQQSKPELRDP